MSKYYSMLPHFIAWFPMLLIAVANGFLRELYYKKYFNDLKAHQLSTVTLIILFGIYMGIIIHFYPPASYLQALLIGLLWFSLTEIFEFSFGIFRGYTWQQMFADYNIVQGRIWILIPLWLLLAPMLFYALLV